MNRFLSSRWRWVALLVLVLLVAVVFNRMRGKAVGVVHIEKGSLIQTVAATGRINAPMRSDISAEVTAKVQRVLVREGDRVKAGSLLVELDAAQAQASLAQALGALQEAQARLVQQAQLSEPQARQNLAQAETAHQVAQREHERAKDLVTKGFYSQQKLDDTRKQLETARSAHENAKLQAQAQTSSGVDTQLLRTRLEQAQANARQSAALRDKYRIVAPYDAIVLARHTEPGNMAQPGKLLLSLAAQGGTRIDASIDEKNLHILTPGMPAKAATDAFASRPFDAKLSYVAPAVDAQKGTVEVRLDIPQPPDFLRTDMTVSVELIGARRNDTWLLPLDAVREPDSTAPWVLVIRDGMATRAPVKLGLRGIGITEILQGLDAADDIVPVSESVAVGDRVRAGTAKPKAKGIEAPQGMFR